MSNGVANPVARPITAAPVDLTRTTMEVVSKGAT